MYSNKHKNYDILNLIGYGLAKFDKAFVRHLGFASKQDFYRHIVDIKIAETKGVVKNRQDLFDPFFKNKRRGWWQKGNAYVHRKKLIDWLFKELDAEAYARMVKFYLQTELSGEQKIAMEPILQSKFKQIQRTGQEAELYFIEHYTEVNSFQNGLIEDARLFGDGYDFQIRVDTGYYLAEVKGIRTESGGFRLTNKEFNKAKEYKNNFALVVVSNLYQLPKISVVFDPVSRVDLIKRETRNTQISYHSKTIDWRKAHSYE